MLDIGGQTGKFEHILFFTWTEWIKWNLTHGIRNEYVKKVLWPTLFKYLCWDAWVSCCKKLFNCEATDMELNAQHSFFRACSDNDIFKIEGMKKMINSFHTNWNQQEEDFIKAVADDLILEDGRSRCEGYLWNQNDRWLVGINCRLVNVPSIFAEIIYYIQGLQMCWSKRVYKD